MVRRGVMRDYRCEKCGYRFRALHGEVWHKCPMAKMGKLQALVEVDGD